MPSRREFVDRSAHACAGLAAAGGLGAGAAAASASESDTRTRGLAQDQRQRILIIGMTGSENPTRANFTYAWGAALAEDGHEVRIQLVGEAPVLIREVVLDNMAAVGWGPLRSFFDRVVAAGVPIFL